LATAIEEKLRLGTSGWSYKDWVGPFYPPGTAPGSFLSYYATQFRAVEVDSTFYGIPRREMVQGWAVRTPGEFTFVLKVPGIVTHGVEARAGGAERIDLARVLRDEEGNLERFLDVLEPLGSKAGAILFQFPYFRMNGMEARDFLARLEAILAALAGRGLPMRLAVEIRNKSWLGAEYSALLGRHRAAAVLLDHPYMPWPRESLALGMVTADFAYVRLIGDRYAIEKKTRTWGAVVEDRSDRLREWSDAIHEIAARPHVRTLYAFSNNHFAGHGPATCRTLLSLLGGGTEEK
jgi:uncharacterized protein YecE (DUF72 family)